MPKTIVCLANGAWNERASGHATNVVLLCDMLDDTDKTHQVVKYADGVGTGVFRLTRGALGVGLSANVRELYISSPKITNSATASRSSASPAAPSPCAASRA